MNKRKYIVYKITNTVNSLIYIGRTTQPLKARWRTHLSGLNAAKNRYIRLYCAMREFGREVFKIEVVATANSFSELKTLEKEWILKTRSYLPEIGYNMSIDTDNGLEMIDASSIERKISSLHEAQAAKHLGQYGLGVRLTNGTFYANIAHKNVQYNVPCATQNDAALTFDKLALHFHGKRAIRNYPDIEHTSDQIAEALALAIQIKNRRPTSAFWGVSFLKGAFMASIWSKEKCVFLGKYAREEEAAIAVDKARVYLGINRDHLNFPDKILEYQNDPTGLKNWFDSLHENHQRGVRYDSRIKKYAANIKLNGKWICLGYYTDPIQAARIRDMGIVAHKINEVLNYPENEQEYQISAFSVIEAIINKRKRYRGVFYNPKKRHYRASIAVNRKTHYLGSFKTEREAAIAYNKGAKLLLGDKARLNEIA